MKLAGIELSNFRSIGNTPVVLNPFRKCNIVIGQNNIGKSNVLRAINKIFEKLKDNQNKIMLDGLDYHGRNRDTELRFKLWFEANNDRDADDKAVKEHLGESIFWFDVTWPRGKRLVVRDFSFAHIPDFNKANRLLEYLVNQSWSSRVSQEDIRRGFLKASDNILSRFAAYIPAVYVLPEFRQIKQGDNYSHDGTGLIKLLAEYQAPPIGKDPDQLRFEKVQNFVRHLLHLPNALLEFPRGEPAATLVIRNGDLRLPLSSLGTGVHELIIMLTAVLSRDDCLWCIEEPEIHLHPRLQRELVEFLVNETNNQYLITTHSPTLINSLTTNSEVSVFHLHSHEGITIGTPIVSEADGLKAIRDLGLKPSDLIQANCIIWVEGLSDRIYIQKYIELLNPDLVEGRDYIFMYYRSLPKLNFETDTFAEELINVIKLNPNAILVIDHDGNKKEDSIDKVKDAMKTQCENNGGLCWVTDGREIENYLTDAVVKKSCKDLREVDIEIQIHPFDEFSEFIDKALKEKDGKPLNYNKEKLNYSRKIAEYITLDDMNEQLKERMSLILAKIKEWNI